ncbi:hypothetical protein [Leptospira haakeii]|uniref:Lipoprotein n=1 Tax=Leptospira haakeii TaxID=2023198 RepID=A0ABX4PTV8_9LEPT|nr:hypothetical protein [Leptospira haakeii]PKA17524.1 hypothetical protein CH363_02435 [Leptospira haakeii]PKA21248.1 hypothetical protein CH377_02435 [Leptospira haakeii]
MRKFRTKAIILLFALSLINTACFETEKSESDNSAIIAALIQANYIEVGGSWQIGYYSGGSDGGVFGTAAITAQSWIEQGMQKLTIVEIDNANRKLYYQASADDSSNPSKYGRIDWTAIHSNSCPSSASRCFEYCQIVYGKNTLAEAKSDPATSNPSAIKTNGCNGFGYNYMIP